MINRSILFFVCLLMPAISAGFPSGPELVEREYLWISPNTRNSDSTQNEFMSTRSIRNQSYQSYLNEHGEHPPYSFLEPLKECDPAFTRIEKDEIFFKESDRRVPLIPLPFAEGATFITPYLLSTINQKWIIAVFPYYLFQNKENRYLTKVYTAEGSFRATFNSLPTHVSLKNPDLFVSPERTGCCESQKWAIRFYVPEEGAEYEYSCPEGFCGDFLFVKPDDQSPFIIVQEIVSEVREVGASIQTNFYVVGNDGKLKSSAKTVYAMHEPGIRRKTLESRCPFSIANLVSLGSSNQKDWVFHFRAGNSNRSIEVGSIFDGLAPAVIYALPKSSSAEGATIKAHGTTIGSPPMLVVSDPGNLEFEFIRKGDEVERSLKEIKADYINILTF